MTFETFLYVAWVVGIPLFVVGTALRALWLYRQTFWQ